MSLSELSFDQLNLNPQVLEAVTKAGYKEPSPIQVQTIPILLSGNDVLGMAQTGTGKTAAFALPCLSNLDLKNASPQVMVLAPTRELAIQVADSFVKYGAFMKGLKVQCLYGGQSYGEQLRALRAGVHVIVGTPGRIMDHMRRKTLNLEQLKCLVLDEADEMLRMGFIDDVEWILEQTPKNCQMALFSATMPKEIRTIANRYMKDAEHVTIKSKTATVVAIEQLGVIVKGFQKAEALVRVLESETFDGMIIFARTKTATLEVCDLLKSHGHQCAALNGDIPQNQREQIIQDLKKGHSDIVVATDVAARGLDVERISHVINYDIPTDHETYVHRIGRTGRAGRSGKAILFVKPTERRMLRTIEQATRQSITLIDMPSAKAVNEKRIEKFKAIIQEALSSEKLGYFENLVEDFHQNMDLDYKQIAVGLLKLIDQAKPLQCKELHVIRSKDFDDRDRSRGRGRDRDFSDSKQRPRRGDFKANARDGMERYRVEVGRDHGVRPGNIVGAIANEIDMNSSNIGQIDIHSDYTTVDLPKGLSQGAIDILKKVWVAGQQLRISTYSQGERGVRPGRRDFKSSKDKPKKLKRYQNPAYEQA